MTPPIPIGIYDIYTGKLIYIAKSYKEAASYMNCSKQLVYAAINGKNRVRHIKNRYKVIKASGSMPDQIAPIGSLVDNRHHQEVVQLDGLLKFIRLHQSLRAAGEAIGGGYATNIARSADEFGHRTAYGYFWAYKEEYIRYLKNSLEPIPPELDEKLDPEIKYRLGIMKRSNVV